MLGVAFREMLYFYPVAQPALKEQPKTRQGKYLLCLECDESLADGGMSSCKHVDIRTHWVTSVWSQSERGAQRLISVCRHVRSTSRGFYGNVFPPLHSI